MSAYGIHSRTHRKMNNSILHPLDPISGSELQYSMKHSPKIYQPCEPPTHDTWPHLEMSPSSKSLPRSTRPPSTAHVDARMRYCKTSVRHPQVMCPPQYLSSMESRNNFPLQRSTRPCQSVKCSVVQSLGPMLVSVEDHHASTALC